MISRAGMITGVQYFLRHVNLVLRHFPSFAIAVGDDVLRQQTFDFGLVANRRQFLTMARAFGKHAQIKHGARAIGEIKHDISIVPNIGRLAVIFFVQMIDVLPA